MREVLPTPGRKEEPFLQTMGKSLPMVLKTLLYPLELITFVDLASPFSFQYSDGMGLNEGGVHFDFFSPTRDGMYASFVPLLSHSFIHKLSWDMY